MALAPVRHAWAAMNLVASTSRSLSESAFTLAAPLRAPAFAGERAFSLTALPALYSGVGGHAC